MNDENDLDRCRTAEALREVFKWESIQRVVIQDHDDASEYAALEIGVEQNTLYITTRKRKDNDDS